ncbi:multiple epidermal growth factor-like domains protein 6 [Xenia sp. Carnegie-2017]|uniref:multiple epidermal growth factor-like domains protein 6 n=1 Tax=Xenia sp. Carnegie-2017 TaxID=2897299 RepID=UPI001F043824|nr:multiple epidermal growth factor-like domains protein 6 [Xenia sp. Carnegie-2017]
MKLCSITSLLLLFHLVLIEGRSRRKKLHLPYDILSKDAKGWEAIGKSLNVLKLSRVFPTDRNILKRIALVESSMNKTSNRGGIWNVRTCAFYGVTQNRAKYGKRLKKIQKIIGRKFGIKWNRLTYDQLERPIFSLLAARLYLYMIFPDGLPRGASTQSKIWSDYYHNCGVSKKTNRKHLIKLFKKVVRGSCHSSYKKCDHHCVEISIGYGECQCKPKFMLDSDGRSCKAIIYRNPCTLNNGKVCEHSCLKIKNTVICTCPDGHYLHNNRYKCLDINECLLAPCQHECHNTPGSYHCACFPGYSLDYNQKRTIFNFRRSDRSSGCIASNDPSCIIRCMRQNNMLDECVCPPGMALHHDNETCVESNGCLTSDGFCHHSCVRTASGFSCACKPGFMLDTNSVTCTDIDECSIGEHSCEKGCLNVPGGYHCLCPLGFKLNKDGYSCSDINECLMRSDLCKSPAKCENLKEITDVTVQLDSNSMQPNIVLMLTNVWLRMADVNIHVITFLGVVNVDVKQVIDLALTKTLVKVYIDECNNFPTICSHICINTPGSYKCSCPPGTTSIENGGLCL